MIIFRCQRRLGWLATIMYGGGWCIGHGYGEHDGIAIRNRGTPQTETISSETTPIHLLPHGVGGMIMMAWNST
uniref:Putative secreted protein n=1 Tax=Anopheles marajoara TaxID=58244 RepID=A0A2M4CDM1_9DIPT